jgi:hypothetical protein
MSDEVNTGGWGSGRQGTSRTGAKLGGMGRSFVTTKHEGGLGRPTEFASKVDKFGAGSGGGPSKGRWKK